MNKEFLLFGNGSEYNRGCQAIRLSTIEILRQAFAGTGFCYCFFTRDGDKFLPPESMRDVQCYAMKSLKRFSRHWFRYQLTKALHIPYNPVVKEILKKRSIAALFSIGGDNFSLDYGVPYPFFGANALARENKVPVIIWGASIGLFTAFPKLERTYASELKKVDLILVRESHTKAYLETLGVKDNVRFVADPAFLLPRKSAILPNNVEVMLRKKCIGLNLSLLVGSYRDNPGEWLNTAAEWCSWLLQNTDMPLLLIPHVVFPKNGDQIILRQIKEKLNVPDERLVLLDISAMDACQIKEIIARLHIFIGARTHATIAALSSAVPTLSLGYSIKSRGINSDIFGHENWVKSVEQLSTKTFGDAVHSLLEQAGEVRKYLQSFMPEYKQRAVDATLFVAELLKKYH